ncbi:MAG TPA: hypothetical protein DDZ80_31995 [Cyanobacteria bacterium UBA8803]|nr:hypothetical protein [Cyanobacteria bacterium UBA9273]HBL62831.1 hypothetical protein [Cyanobacteria bacterium UBA8803]
MNRSSLNIGTWIYCESPGEESKYPQVGGSSSSIQFQAVYWRCVVVYFACSVRNNPTANHLLFTNVHQIPDLGTFKTGQFLAQLGVKVISLPFTYQTPVGYFGAWRNQFYIFDVLKYLTQNCNSNDCYIILDSDCLWVNSADRIVADIQKYGLLTYDMSYPVGKLINGLTQLDMKKIYEELDGKTLDEAPTYFGGEWFGATGQEIKKVSAEFEPIWEFCLSRFANNQPKFNEEAHALSYIYHKLGYATRTANPYIRRIWTSPQLYGARPEDMNLHVWHTPTEKRYGLKRLFKQVINLNSPFWNLPLGQPFIQYLARYLGIPKPTLLKVILDRFDDKISGLRKRLSFTRRSGQ